MVSCLCHLPPAGVSIEKNTVEMHFSCRLTDITPPAAVLPYTTITTTVVPAHLYGQRPNGLSYF
jgi:hypothetical protein